MLKVASLGQERRSRRILFSLRSSFVFQFLPILGVEPPLAVVVLLVGALVVVLILYYAWLQETLSG